MIRLIKFVPLLILASCLTSKNNNLETNETIKKVFTESETHDLVTILDFFETQICVNEKVNRNLIFDCYNAFFIRLDSLESTGSIDTNLSFRLQKQLYRDINESTFNEIWQFGKASLHPPKDTLKQISIKYDGKYVQFLKEMGYDDKIIKDYYESFMIAGQISPGSIAHLLKMYDDYDTKDIRIRLVIAIHYLTLNDYFERKEKYEDM